MTKKKRSSKRQPADTTVLEMTRALKALPKPARAILREHIKDLDNFRRRYPRLYDVMFKNVDSKDWRRVERNIEQWQEQKRRDA